MLKEIFKKSYYVFEEGFENWRDAVWVSYKPLLREKIVNEDYINSVIDCIEKYGPYIVIAPNIAMPHSSEGAEGCNGTAISFMKVNTPVKFDLEDEEKDAVLFFSLAADNHDKHVKNIQLLMETLVNEEMVAELMSIKNEEDLKKIVEKYS